MYVCMHVCVYVCMYIYYLFIYFRQKDIYEFSYTAKIPKQICNNSFSYKYIFVAMDSKKFDDESVPFMFAMSNNEHSKRVFHIPPSQSSGKYYLVFFYFTV